ncbi:epithelial splicing regulatory protein 2 isoform X2 [Anoplophora glabripennis]|nr:epithelial splicing regulatory protein 2 isoform X2 [Anoplophora glabripennis]
MLSSRTEMQRVIEAARAQSYAAFMQPSPASVPMPAVVPSIVPAAVPEIKKESKEIKSEKRDSRRRSRSKSRDRKDRSRERERKDKRHRDRSRSRSRDRKERRRRDRSRSRGRSRSRDRDRRNSRDHRRRSEEKAAPVFQRDPRKPMPEIWANQNPAKSVLDVAPAAPAASILSGFPINLEQAKRTLNSLTAGLQANGFAANTNGPSFTGSPQGRTRDSWPPTGIQNFQGRSNDGFQNKRQNMGPGNGDNFQGRFQRHNFQRDGHRNRMDDNYMDCCVSLEPFYGSYGEVRRFFHGLYISNKSIKFINDSSGHRTGVVYVQFANRKSKEEAMTLNGEILNGISVAVSHVDDGDFEEAVDRFVPNNINDDGLNDGPMFKNRTKYFNNAPAEPEVKDYTCLIVEDLPTYCKEQDILHIFSQHPLVALILTTKPRGGNIAYVKFSSKDVAKKALEEKGHHVIGGKQVTVRPCKDDDFEEINKQHEVDLTGSKDSDVGTDCLSVARLPPKTNDKDIADFFSDIGVIPTKIHLMSNNLGFTGQAYCEFLNADEAARAAKKDDTMLGNIHISVKPIKREEMETILGHTLPAPVNSSSSPVEVPPAPGKNQPTNPLMKPGLPVPMNSPLGGQNPPMNEHKLMNPRPFFSRGGFDGRPTRGPPRFGPRGMGGPRLRFAPPQEHFDEAPHPGCTVFMKNVPYKAGTNEILDFFDGYNMTNNVSRRYNPNNTPSDEAKVVFFDPDEAFRAVQDLHHKKIWDRQIYLRQE